MGEYILIGTNIPENNNHSIDTLITQPDGQYTYMLQTFLGATGSEYIYSNPVNLQRYFSFKIICTMSDSIDQSGINFRMTGLGTDNDTTYSFVTNFTGLIYLNNVFTGNYQVEVKKDSFTTILDTITVGTGFTSKVYTLRSINYLTNNYFMNQNWNLVSVPLLLEDYQSNVIFPAVASRLFCYIPGQGYAAKDTLANGFGYWVKYNSNSSLPMSGYRLNRDTVEVKQGWNLIGSITDTVQTASITTIPSGIIASSYFGYSGGYNFSSVIKPVKGYWIKSSADGKFILSPEMSYLVQRHLINPKEPLDKFNTLKIRDCMGNEQTLYFGAENLISADIRYYELPPTPPSEIFDARFSCAEADYLLKTHPVSKSEITSMQISVQSVSYPITINWHIFETGFNYELYDGLSEKVFKTRKLSGDGEFILENSSLKKFELLISSAIEIPTEYILEQNYPNPFNPSTTIKYGLPEPTYVTLTIHNTLGQRVALLVNEQQKEGYHRVVFSNPNLSSGVYFYRLQAGTYNNTKKLLFIK
jgi:hypothetical protein